MRIGFMFAGQGAQVPGMGRDLAQTSDAAREVFDRADAALQRELSALCFEGTAEELTTSANCQPAIFTVSLACVAAFREQMEVAPAVCGGLSLGEFGAVTTAGALDVDDGVRLVARRGELMDKACRETNGAMAAVIGGDPTLVTNVASEHDVDVANYNCPGQIVISGDAEKLQAAIRALEEAGVSRVVPLQVAGAYHSRLMEPAARSFERVLADVPLERPRCPVAQNAVGALVEDPEEIRENLRRQVTGSVRWEECVRAMMGAEVEALIEFGPGRVLTGFMRRINRRFPVYNIGNADDVQKTVAALQA